MFLIQQPNGRLPLLPGGKFRKIFLCTRLHDYYLASVVSLTCTAVVVCTNNHFGVGKDDVTSFIFYGQIGIGANLAFVLIDVGYNYGFEGLMKDFSNTKPGQWFFSLGVKF